MRQEGCSDLRTRRAAKFNGRIKYFAMSCIGISRMFAFSTFLFVCPSGKLICCLFVLSLLECALVRMNTITEGKSERSA